MLIARNGKGDTIIEEIYSFLLAALAKLNIGG